MKRQFKAIFAIALIFLSSSTVAEKSGLPRSTPEEQGVSSQQLISFFETANKKINTLHSVMIVRHGHVIAEAWWKPEAADKQHVLWSLTKSFSSTAVGMAVDEGKLSVDDPVIKFFPNDGPEKPSKNLQAMRVRDLLTMNTGHDVEVKLLPSPLGDKTSESTDKTWVQSFLAHPVTYKPGTHFHYNTPGSFMLSAIVQKVTGQTEAEYLRTRLFEPLGIEKLTWNANPQGISIGGYGLHLCTEDIAKFGQLYLQKGEWNGKQLLSEKWIAQATSKQVSNGSNPAGDWDQGYGFQFWRCRHNAFRGDGMSGQLCIVLPDQDAVIAITAKTGDMQNELNVIWDFILPALHEKALPADADSAAKLKVLLDKLEVPPAPATRPK